MPKWQQMEGMNGVRNPLLKRWNAFIKKRWMTIPNGTMIPGVLNVIELREWNGGRYKLSFHAHQTTDSRFDDS